MTWKNFYRPLLICLLIAHAAGFIGMLFPAGEWYHELAKAEFHPPQSTFGIVWPILYTLIGISAFIIWQKRRTINIIPVAVIFAIQWVLNTAWPIIFFGAENIGLALTDIAFLLIIIFIMMWQFSRISNWAGLLLVPYFLWTCFAFLLNFSIWQLN